MNEKFLEKKRREGKTVMKAQITRKIIG